ncbi:MAG TPA: EAL domain-containing protein, partial [Deltaproteobacteria bacterium]|nr:EAL domain-containing protein [Deltaproteobacteria bacterium]
CHPWEQQQALAAVHAGAHDYLIRGRDAEEAILRLVCAALERRSSTSKLQYLAHHDGLTGLANRVLFNKCLEDANHQDQPSRIGILYLDLDGFRAINDLHGHEVGDEVLRIVAGRIRGEVQGFDVVARVGGDEFAILLDHLEQGEATKVAQRVMTSLQRPISALGQELSLSCSVGVASRAPSRGGISGLLRAADEAMCRAKRSGQGHIHVSEPQERGPDQRRRLHDKLRGALSRGEFSLDYQPQVDAEGQLFGVEALLRWHHDDQLIGPNTFIPILEETGQIVPVGAWVLQQALAQLATWRAAGVMVPRMAVNVSPVQLQESGFSAVVATLLSQIRVPPSSLELEVTERVVMSDHGRCLNNMDMIRELGVRLALDDFGTGYASLAYLHRFPVDTLKVDRSFVREIHSNAKSASIVGSILDLGRRLGVATVAEGVETEEQVVCLRNEGCRIMQGFLFGRPRPGAIPPLSQHTGSLSQHTGS